MMHQATGAWFRVMCQERAQVSQAKRAVAQAKNSEGEALAMKPACEGSGGAIGSENADVSSDKEGERPSRRKSKGSCLKLI